MNLLIGGSGFIGTNLAQLLSKDSFQILDKQPSSAFPDQVHLSDVRIPSSFAEQLAGTEVVVLLAAEHRDDVSPISLYDEVNVNGARNVVEALRKHGVQRLIFTSTVAVYGLNRNRPHETDAVNPFGHYGQSKWQAEEVLRAWWQEAPDERELVIVRPCVVFGKSNRGNVYNLLQQIASGRFLMIGSGENRKSLAYIGNVAAFLKHLLDRPQPGYRLYNYVDSPDFTMNRLVLLVRREISDFEKFAKNPQESTRVRGPQEILPSPPAKGEESGMVRIPYWLGMLGGYGFDALAKLSGRKLPISSVRVQKFCATTQFAAEKLQETGFVPPFTLDEGLRRTLAAEFGNGNV